MGNWNQTLDRITTEAQVYDNLRREFIDNLAEQTKRNIIVYYSGWLQKPGISVPDFLISDSDMTGFMTCCSGMDKSKGLDLILHTWIGTWKAEQPL